MPISRVPMERCPPSVPTIRKGIEDKKESIFEMDLDKELKRAQLTTMKNRLQRCRDEIKRCRLVGVGETDSMLLTGGTQRFPISVILQRLEKLEKELIETSTSLEREINAIGIRISNADDDINELKMQEVSESGVLMQRMFAGKQFRCIAFNEGNAETNDVLGGASSGVEYCIAAYEHVVILFNIIFGTCEKVLINDPKGHHQVVLSPATPVSAGTVGVQIGRYACGSSTTQNMMSSAHAWASCWDTMDCVVHRARC